MRIPDQFKRLIDAKEKTHPDLVFKYLSGKKHTKLFIKGGVTSKKVTIPSSPGDWRSILNFETCLKKAIDTVKAGLVK